MQRKMIVLVMGLFLLILGGTGVALGADQQVVGQAADSSQEASSTATSTQENPSNQNIDVRIFSPGDAGAVTQTNSSAAAAAAANANATDQSAQQQQGGGSGATQAVGQDATSTQSADSDATSTQTHPSNTNIAVRIDSPGNGGKVTQTNSSEAVSEAANLNTTDQSATQQHGGGACCATGGTQAIGQKAHNDQDATSEATSTQVKPSNTNIGVRIGSAGDDGAVNQTNSSAAAAGALNANTTDQSATQQQGGGGACCATGGTQAIGQKAHNDQDADASATSTQSGASNVNAPVRIFSPGNGGSVTQTNASVAAAGAANLNWTDQSATQSQGGDACCKPAVERTPCCSGGTGVQAIGQFADSSQDADSSATSTQDHPSNTNTPVRIGSSGDDGAVTQTNASIAAAAAANLNATDQSATQQQAGGLGTGVQAIGQKAGNDQDADASATSTQSGASNTNAPVRIWSPGGGGSVEQTNASVALSEAVNLNTTDQSATQAQGGGGCCGLATGVQAIGQDAWSSQEADSDADASQYGASNTNTPVRIGSSGDDGAVTQTNASIAAAKAANLNATYQSADQSQAGGGCCVRTPMREKVATPCCSGGTGVQAIGQFAHNRQDADASADSKQIAPCNVNYPVREYSPGGGGSVSQSNVSLAESLALNANWLNQHAVQQQGGVV